MRIELKQYGQILTSRPAGREAALAMRAYLKPKSKEKVELDFEGVLSMSPSWLDEVLTFLYEEYGRGRVVCLPSKNLSVKMALEILQEEK